MWNAAARSLEPAAIDFDLLGEAVEFLHGVRRHVTVADPTSRSGLMPVLVDVDGHAVAFHNQGLTYLVRPLHVQVVDI